VLSWPGSHTYYQRRPQAKGSGIASSKNPFCALNSLKGLSPLA